MTLIIIVKLLLKDKRTRSWEGTEEILNYYRELVTSLIVLLPIELVINVLEYDYCPLSIKEIYDVKISLYDKLPKLGFISLSKYH